MRTLIAPYNSSAAEFGGIDFTVDDGSDNQDLYAPAELPDTDPVCLANPADERCHEHFGIAPAEGFFHVIESSASAEVGLRWYASPALLQMSFSGTLRAALPFTPAVPGSGEPTIDYEADDDPELLARIELELYRFDGQLVKWEVLGDSDAGSIVVTDYGVTLAAHPPQREFAFGYSATPTEFWVEAQCPYTLLVSVSFGRPRGSFGCVGNCHASVPWAPIIGGFPPVADVEVRP